MRELDSFDVAIGARQADDGHSTISLATISCRQERKDEETAEEYDLRIGGRAVMLMHECDIGFLILSHFALRPWLAVCVQWRPETSSCIQRSVAVCDRTPSHPAGGVQRTGIL
jgi:hypothetical protein